MTSHETKLITRALLWNNEADRTPEEINAYLSGLDSAGVDENTLREIIVALNRANQQDESKTPKLDEVFAAMNAGLPA